MMKVLIGIDESTFTQKSLTFLKNYLAQSVAEIHLLHTIPNAGKLSSLYPQIQDELWEQGQELLQKHVLFLESIRTPCFPRILVGNTASSILNYAEQHEIDLIIVGCRGLSEYQSLSLGSVSHNVSDQSKVPVLIIK